MIYDVFPFFNELEVLDIRLNVHGPFVDRFVLIEGDRTHSGLPKPFYYLENKHLFEKFNNRIAHIGLRCGQAECPQWPSQYFGQSNPFVNEGIQRNYGLQAMADYKDEDIILLSDTDEITRFENLDGVKIVGVERLEHREYYCYLNIWSGYSGAAKIFRGADFRSWDSSFHKMRFCPARNEGVALPPFKEIGWHFSFMGGPARVKQKLEAYAEHADYNRPHITDPALMANRIANMQDILCRNSDKWFKKVPIDEEHHPKYVVENQKKFAHLIL